LLPCSIPSGFFRIRMPTSEFFHLLFSSIRIYAMPYALCAMPFSTFRMPTSEFFFLLSSVL
jgi:hypothetical protein